MKQLENILKNHQVDYTISPHNSGAIVLLLFPYAPFEEYPEGHLFLDNYYLTSHSAYHKTKEIIQDLMVAGYPASRYKAEFLKPLAERLGRATRCKNDLTYTKEYGSYFHMEAIFIDKNFDLPPPKIVSKTALPPCDLCIKACPNNALSDSGFDRSKCIRQFMNRNHNTTEEEKAAIGNRLMGCIECRRACPINAHIKPIKIPPEVLAATKINSIDFEKISQFCGGNLFK